MADAKKGAAPAKKGKSYQMYKLYKIEGGKIVSRPTSSPKLGAGYFMAAHKDRLTCGSSGYMEKKVSK